MVKKIIFDLDDTLIPWDDKWYLEIPKLLSKYNIPFKEEYFGLFQKAIDNYEKDALRYDYSTLTEFINKYMNVNLPDGFIKELTTIFGTLVPDRDEKLIELLDYLSNKYTLVVATNWFKDQQVSKLKLFGIYDYFDEIITGEDYDLKPNPAMFDYLKKDLDNSEIVMVGDSYITDIMGAINSNIHAYFITKDKNYKSNQDYTVIESIYDLRRYL